jgi:carotenoid cleavage dioxygenase-like enzyme
LPASTFSKARSVSFCSPTTFAVSTRMFLELETSSNVAGRFCVALNNAHLAKLPGCWEQVSTLLMSRTALHLTRWRLFGVRRFLGRVAVLPRSIEQIDWGRQRSSTSF